MKKTDSTQTKPRIMIYRAAEAAAAVLRGHKCRPAMATLRAFLRQEAERQKAGRKLTYAAHCQKCGRAFQSHWATHWTLAACNRHRAPGYRDRNMVKLFQALAARAN